MTGLVAYMDPGTGSLFLQMLLGGVAGLAVVVKLFWKRLLCALGFSRQPEAAEAAPHPSSTDEARPE